MPRPGMTRDPATSLRLSGLAAIRFPPRYADMRSEMLVSRLRAFGRTHDGSPQRRTDKEWSVDKAPELPLPADLARVIGWLRGHLSEPIDLERLASIAGVRPRTAGNAFQSIPGHDAAWMGAQDASGSCAPGTGTRSRGCDSDRYRSGKRLHAAWSLRCQLPRGVWRGAFDDLRRSRHARAGEDEIDDEAFRLTGRRCRNVFAIAPRQCSEALEDLESIAKRRRAMVCRSRWPHGVGRNAPRMDSARLRGMIAITRCGWLQRPARWRRTTLWL